MSEKNHVMLFLKKAGSKCNIFDKSEVCRRCRSWSKAYENSQIRRLPKITRRFSKITEDDPNISEDFLAYIMRRFATTFWTFSQDNSQTKDETYRLNNQLVYIQML